MHFCTSPLLSTHLVSWAFPQLTEETKILHQNLQVERAAEARSSNGNGVEPGSTSWTFFSICQANPFGSVCSELLVRAMPASPRAGPTSALHCLVFVPWLRTETQDGWLRQQHRQLRHPRKYLLSGALQSGSVKFICTVVEINTSN